MNKTIEKKKVENKVVKDNFRKSENFYSSDLILREYLERKLSLSAKKYMEDKLQYTGKQAAIVMDELSLDADKEGPKLVKRSFFWRKYRRY